MKISNNVINADNINRLAMLLTVISKLDMDISGYGQIDVNPNSNYLYVWAEDYPFTPYINSDNEINFMWTCGYCGSEHAMKYVEGETTLEAIEEWIESLYRDEGQHCEDCMEDEEDEE